MIHCLTLVSPTTFILDRVWLAMGGSSSTLLLGATFLENAFTSATPPPYSSEPNNVQVLDQKTLGEVWTFEIGLVPAPSINQTCKGLLEISVLVNMPKMSKNMYTFLAKMYQF